MTYSVWESGVSFTCTSSTRVAARGQTSPSTVHFFRWVLHKIVDTSQFLCRVLWTDEAVLQEVVYTIYTTCLHGQRRILILLVIPLQHRFSVNVWAGFVYVYVFGLHVVQKHLDGAQYAEFFEERLSAFRIDGLGVEVSSLGIHVSRSDTLYFYFWWCKYGQIDV
jgi:hypothetical protein